MFTGIIEAMGKVVSATPAGSGMVFEIESPLAAHLKVDQSLSHNGVCLTIEAITNDKHRVTAIRETLDKTTCDTWQPGTLLNLERCVQAGGRFDGHIVQGHVDTKGTCIHRENLNGSWLYRFSFPAAFAHLVIEKGSIAVNGISLTCFDVDRSAFSVAIIPYTYTHTNLSEVTSGNFVNLEFDLLGKYLQRKWSLEQTTDH
jgi:riboflavin synthase